MSRRALGLIVGVAALVLVVASGATAASANKSVTPKLGFYEGPKRASSLPGPTSTSVLVVKTGKRQGAKFQLRFGLTCPSGGEILKMEFYWIEETPIPIKNGKFAFDRTIDSGVLSGDGYRLGTGTPRLVVSGTFKSATKVVVKASVAGSYDLYYREEQPSVKVKCTGKQTATAKLKHR